MSSSVRIEGRSTDDQSIGVRFTEVDARVWIEVSDGLTAIKISVPWPEMDRVGQWFTAVRRPAEQPTYPDTQDAPRIRLSGSLPPAHGHKAVPTPNTPTPGQTQNG